jgi:hypothetical protein
MVRFGSGLSTQAEATGVPNSVMGDLVSQLRLAFHRLQDWAYPDEIDHALFRAYMKTPHDVGGEPDARPDSRKKKRSGGSSTRL